MLSWLAKKTIARLLVASALLACAVALPLGPLAGATSPQQLRPPITRRLIPFGPKRKREMAAYSERHYGEHTWRLRHPHVIVEHYAEAGTAAAVYNTFAPDVPDPELHELPNVCAHFVVSSSGRIFQLVNLTDPLPAHGRAQLDRDRDRAHRLQRRGRARRPPPSCAPRCC